MRFRSVVSGWPAGVHRNGDPKPLADPARGRGGAALFAFVEARHVERSAVRRSVVATRLKATTAASVPLARDGKRTVSGRAQRPARRRNGSRRLQRLHERARGSCVHASRCLDAVHERPLRVSMHNVAELIDGLAALSRAIAGWTTDSASASFAAQDCDRPRARRGRHGVPVTEKRLPEFHTVPVPTAAPLSWNRLESCP